MRKETANMDFKFHPKIWRLFEFSACITANRAVVHKRRCYASVCQV